MKNPDSVVIPGYIVHPNGLCEPFPSPQEQAEPQGMYEETSNKQTPEYHPASYATNPKDALGVRKVPFSTLSGPVLAAMGNAMLEGALKYGRHNYRVIGVKASVYFDAFNRHIWAWWEGEDIDPESGKSHLVKALTCLLVLVDAAWRGKMIDDRPPKSLGFIQEENVVTEKLLAAKPNPIPPFTERPI